MVPPFLTEHSIVKRIIFGTKNEHKLQEVRDILSEFPFIVLDKLPSHVPSAQETGKSFLENAIQKALFYSGLVHEPVLAEDSGIVVVPLGRFPGIQSARWGEGNLSQFEKNLWIIQQLRDLPSRKRVAYYECALVYVEGKDVCFTTVQRVIGVIASRPVGQKGFGYDPIFYFQPLRKTFAQIPQKRKNLYSHRGKAFRRWAEWYRSMRLEPFDFFPLHA